MSPFKEGGSPSEQNAGPEANMGSWDLKYSTGPEQRRIIAQRAKLERIMELLRTRNHELAALEANTTLDPKKKENMLNIKKSEIKALERGRDSFQKELAEASASRNTREEVAEAAITGRKEAIIAPQAPKQEKTR